MPPVITSSRRKSSGKGSKTLLITLAAVVVAAVVVYFLQSGKDSASPAGTTVSAKTTATPSAIKESPADAPAAATPAVVEKASAAVTSASDAKTGKADLEDDPVNPLSGLPQSKHEIWYKEEMERNAHVAEVIEARNPRVHFDNPIENELEAVWSSDVIEINEVPRIDGFTEEQIIAYLKKPVVYNEDDDEFTVASKKNAEQAKKDALEYIGKGFTINDYLRDAAASHNEANETRRDVREEMERILDNEGEEAAIAYLNEVNPQLEKEGIKPVSKPGRIARIKSRKRLERQQREAAEAASQK